ncbi:MAG: DUF2238 domain-containing protein [Actinomycetota bacterium]
MPRIVRDHPLLAVVSLGYVVGFTVFGIATERGQTTTYLVQLAVTFALVAAIHERVGFSGHVLWALSFWGLLHAAGGILYTGEEVLYRFKAAPVLPRFDQAVHAFGFGAATVAVWQGLRTELRRGTQPGAGIGFVVALAGMGVGALNEVLEFLSTRIFAETNVGGYVNTGWDLVYNALGASAAAAWIAIRERRTGTALSLRGPVDGTASSP